MKRIMIVDDDVHIGDMLEEALTAEGYETRRAYSGTEALLLLKAETPDLILLDLMLPGLSGEEVLSRVQGTPVIVLSAKADVSDKVSNLLGGAVDYVTKPFDTNELLARITVALRTQPLSGGSGSLRFGDVELDLLSHTARCGRSEIRLTRTEFAILKMMILNRNQVISKSALLDSIFADTPDCTEYSLKTHVSNLRGKLREIAGRDIIESVWGIGWRLRGSDEE